MLHRIWLSSLHMVRDINTNVGIEKRWFREPEKLVAAA